MSGIGIGIENNGIGIGIELKNWNWPQPCFGRYEFWDLDISQQNFTYLLFRQTWQSFPGIFPCLLNMEYAVLLMLAVSLLALNHMKIDNKTSFIFCLSVVALSAVTKTLLSSAKCRSWFSATAVCSIFKRHGKISGFLNTVRMDKVINRVEEVKYSGIILDDQGGWY